MVRLGLRPLLMAPTGFDSPPGLWEMAMSERRCERCGFASDEKSPVGNDGICLWCRLFVNGIDCQTFYTSGAWQEVIAWRGDPTPGEALRVMICEERERRGDTLERVAELTGLGLSRIALFLGKRSRKPRLRIDMVEGLAGYLSLPVERVIELVGGTERIYYGQESLSVAG